MSKKLKVLSLFDGMSCARQALKNLDIDCEYYASEIDKYAIAVSKYQHPDIIHVGDAKSVKGEDYADLDLLIGGSPCQDLSIAKRNKQGLDGSKSSLFYEYLRILKETKPKVFILENVASMKNSDKDTITKELQAIYPDTTVTMINGSLVTAQSRKRYFWTNIPNVTLPEDRNIVLNDILLGLDWSERLKSLCITATYSRACPDDYYNKGNRQLIYLGGIGNKDIQGDGKLLSRNVPQGQRVYSDSGKSVTLSANGGGLGAKTGLYEIESIISSHMFKEVRTEEGKRLRALLRKEKGIDTTPRNSNNKEVVPRNDNKCNTLNTGITKESYVFDRSIIRKLHPIECERLTSLPDDYTAFGDFDGAIKEVSKTQRYKMCGNAFIVAIIEHLISLSSFT
jgi:DNA-cytosine methyltransferase